MAVGAAAYLLASARPHEGHIHLTVLPRHFGSCGPIRVILNICFWVGMPLHRGALSFLHFILKLRKPVSPVAVVTQMNMGTHIYHRGFSVV